MKAENFIELIEQNRFDKISKNGMTLIAKRFRELQAKQLTIPVVVKSLPNKEKLNFEDWLEFRKIDKLSDGAYRWEGSLYTEYYVKSIYENYLK